MPEPLWVVRKGSATNGKLATCRCKDKYEPACPIMFEWVALEVLRSPRYGLSRAWQVRRLVEAVAKAWALECKGKAVLAADVPELQEAASAAKN